MLLFLPSVILKIRIILRMVHASSIFFSPNKLQTFWNGNIRHFSLNRLHLHLHLHLHLRHPPYCSCPCQRWNENIELGIWVREQRTQYRLLQEGKKSHMTEERMELLKSIGFVWDQLEAIWFERFDELIEYKEEYGNCNVPQRWEENLKLGRWVSNMRSDYRLLQDGKYSPMTEERIELLEDIGFVWNQPEAAWFEQFDELKAYKDEHGNCNVPRRWKENEKLANWVMKQRQQYRLLQEGKKSHMTEERIKLLESIDFKWSLRN